LNHPVVPSNRLHVLSSFADDQIALAKHERESAFCLAQQAYQNHMARRQAEWANLKAQSVSAWKQRRILSWLNRVWVMLCFCLRDRPSHPRMARTTDEEFRFRAGQEGEKRVLRALFAAMPSDWHVVSGYCNLAGETDFVLLTPNGMMVVEVKSYSGEIRCIGNVWTAGKRIRGQWHEKPIRDGGGRAPNQQVNAVADGLASCFGKIAPGLGVGKVLRAVIFASQNARIVRIEHPGVNLVCAPEHLTQERLRRLFPPKSTPLDTGKLLEIIQRDHQFHEKRRTARQKQLSIGKANFRGRDRQAASARFLNHRTGNQVPCNSCAPPRTG